MNLFKRKIADGLKANLEKSLESFYEQYSNTVTYKGNALKAEKWESRMLQGLGVAGLGVACGAGGLFAAMSAPILLTGVGIGFLGLSYTGIAGLVKMHTESKNKYELENQGEDLIGEFSKKLGGEFSINKSDLAEIRKYVKYVNLKDMGGKENFIKEVASKVSSRPKII
ncbi:hypothetical protein [Pseudomonas asiatica]|uniref:hypothetical protein n=1 Tax=Pseudomonas asiatica TaxID=2219225 RepID=UPI0025A4B2CA|nr:hypothetical protein [Pseudomonas asiatica]WJN51230.1 hypothetical protein QUR91_05275 [Pseudomonas asiatica]